MAIFDKVLQQGVKQGIVPARTKFAREWFRSAAESLYQRRVSADTILKDETRLVQNITYGYMYGFSYDPKWKKELPYYDQFPLIFPVELQENGFMGINFHYLPHVLRAKLMDALYTTVNNRKYDDSTRVRISYDVLKNVSKFRMFKPTLKKYLRNHIRSNFLQISSKEWDIALFLPTENFKKATKEKVWIESRKKI